MSLCGRYDFVDPMLSYRVTPYYFKEDELTPDEIPLFEKTVLGYFVDQHSIQTGQRCRVKPQIHLAKHLFATLKSDAVSDSLQGRFHLWLEHKPDSPYEAALESFLKFIDDNISQPRVHRTVDVNNDFDQALQYHTFIINKKVYVAIQPRIESTYLPPYQKPEFYWVPNIMNFERYHVPFYLNRGEETKWYENIQDFYKGGGHGFPTRTRWGENGALFEAFTGGGWVEVHPFEVSVTKSE